MDTEKKQLYAFGYGFALFIPFLIIFHGLQLGFNFLSVIFLVGGVVLLCVLIEKASTIKPIFNIWICALHLFVGMIQLQQEAQFFPFMFLGLAFFFLLVTYINVWWLKPLYHRWMTLAHGIGTIITGIILSVMFYGVFGVVGIIMRIFSIDLLDQKIEREKSSYWIKREFKPFERKAYHRQF